MKRKIIASIFIILMVLFGFLFFRSRFLYNSGNNHYERMDYAGAIEEYEKALAANPFHLKECSMRINLALSMIFNMGDDFDAPENVENSIQTLLAAKEILLAEHCATLEGDGHSETAEQLKEEIDKLIEMLQENDDPSSPEEPDDSENPAGSSTNSITEETEQSIQNQIQDMQNSATQERQENLQFMEEWGQDVNYDLETDIW